MGKNKNKKLLRARERENERSRKNSNWCNEWTGTQKHLEICKYPWNYYLIFPPRINHQKWTVYFFEEKKRRGKKLVLAIAGSTSTKDNDNLMKWDCNYVGSMSLSFRWEKKKSNKKKANWNAQIINELSMKQWIKINKDKDFFFFRIIMLQQIIYSVSV